MLADPNYVPDHMIDQVLDRLDLKNDAPLAQALDVEAPTVSKLRTKALPLGPAMLIYLHELTNLSTGQVREMAGLPARTYVQA
jgi:hypothetical protein